MTGFAGDGGPAISAEIGYPTGIAVTGNVIYFADLTNERVRKIANYNITTVAGTSIGDKGPAAMAFLNLPEGLAIDGSGNVLVADTENAEARIFKAGGNISSVGQLQGGAPAGVAVDKAGNFYITDEEPGFPSQAPPHLEGDARRNYVRYRGQRTGRFLGR